MATGTKKPIDLADRVAGRRGRRSNAAAVEAAWRREAFCLPRDEARAQSAQEPAWHARAQAAIAASKPAHTSWNAGRPAGL